MLELWKGIKLEAEFRRREGRIVRNEMPFVLGLRWRPDQTPDAYKLARYIYLTGYTTEQAVFST